MKLLLHSGLRRASYQGGALQAAEKLLCEPKMALVKACKLLIIRSSDRHFRPILAPKSRFSATCEAVPCLENLGGTPSPGATRRPRPLGGEGRGDFYSFAGVAKRHDQVIHPRCPAENVGHAQVPEAGGEDGERRNPGGGLLELLQLASPRWAKMASGATRVVGLEPAALWAAGFGGSRRFVGPLAPLGGQHKI